MKKYLVFGLFLLTIGCVTKPNDPVVVAYNKQVLSSTGDTVGTLPDGRNVIRYELSRGSNPSHWIYVVDDTTTITTNRTVQQGKTSYQAVEAVIVDGARYVPDKKTE